MTDAPQEDLDILSIAAETALGTYALNGAFQPFGAIQSDAGIMIVPSDGFQDADEKHRFVNIMRFLSIEHGGQRSAFAMETWTMFSQDPEDQRLMDEIYARGGSMSEHPKAGEAIFLIAESDAGSTTRMHRILRNGDRIDLAAAETIHDPRPAPSEPPIVRGIFSNFHVPTGLQSLPQARQFADVMRTMVATRMERIVPTDAPSTN